MVDSNMLIGSEIRNTNDEKGRIVGIGDGIIEINFYGVVKRYAYPGIFQKGFRIEDESINEQLNESANEEKISEFFTTYTGSLKNEIHKLRTDGGKRYSAVDGELISQKHNTYLFDVDTEIIISDDISIIVYYQGEKIYGKITDYNDYQIKIKLNKFIGKKISKIEFTMDQSYLLDKLIDRMSELRLNKNDIAYKLICNGNSCVQKNRTIQKGQNMAFLQATSEEITFIWGPPGTGKTKTLSEIAYDFISKNKRVLMVSYSNVSVDEAVLRVVKRMDDNYSGKVIRYGNPKSELIQESDIYSYNYVLAENSDLKKEYDKLNKEIKKSKFSDSERDFLKKKLKSIRNKLSDSEIKLVNEALFVATTVTKAVVDRTIYDQKFDVVIFDEASMAYVPQVVFTASLAKQHFICLGDFRQLPAISVSKDQKLMQDIFEFTKIKEAVSNDCGHKWLVMLYEQYRMHEDIADFVKVNMYNNLLETNEDTKLLCEEISKKSPFQNKAICLVDLKSLYSLCKDKINGSSRINLLSALISIKIAEKYISEYKVGIITPFNAQCRLIVSLLRTLSEKDDKYKNIKCATVHQFQGSECPIIIYDVVDSFGVKYISTLITTSNENDNANRLFNVAMTRAKGKFIIVANSNFLKYKKLSKQLLFYKALKQAQIDKNVMYGNSLMNTIKSVNFDELIYVDNRENSFSKYLEDLKKAKKSISIDFPGEVEDEDEYLEVITDILIEKSDKIDLRLQKDYDVTLPFEGIDKYCKFNSSGFPITIIDKEIVWFGQPLFDDEIMLKNVAIDVDYYPCFRVKGKYVARILANFLNI